MTTSHKLWSLLTKKQRKSAIALLSLMFVGMILETLGIGLVIPALALMTQGDLAVRYPELSPWLERLGNPSGERLAVAGVVLLLVVYAIKTIFLTFLAWRQVSFAYWMQADLSYRLFAGYLRQPYTFHLQRNSAQLIQKVVNETYVFAQSGLMSGLTLVSELLVLVGIATLMLLVQPVGALIVVLFLGVTGWAILHIPRRRILRWGEAFQLHSGLRIQHLQQGLGSAKDVKLTGREKEFLARYEFHNTSMASSGRRQALVQQLPRLMLEFLAVTGLVVLVLVMIVQGQPMIDLLPSVGLFAAAAFRFLPSANRVIYALQSVRYALPMIDTLQGEFRLLGEGAAPAGRTDLLPIERAVTFDDVSFSYSEVDAPALRAVNIEIQKGAAVGFIGSSGSGKSTLVDILLGLLTPSSGAVKVDGVNICSNLRGWQDQIGYVPQTIFLTDDTLRRNIAFGLADHEIDETTVRRALRAAQLDELVDELPQGLDTIIGERGIRLSGGQRQRIGIARALYHDPAVLVLDEATSSLDVETERGVMDAVQALHGEKTIILVAHRLSTVQCCDRLYRLEKGHIVEEGETATMLGSKVDALAGLQHRLSSASRP